MKASGGFVVTESFIKVVLLLLKSQFQNSRAGFFFTKNF